MNRLTVALSHDARGEVFLFSVQTHWAEQCYLCTAYLPDACDWKRKKRQEISEFWYPENRAEVIRRMIASKYASFEPLSTSC
jgi:hypothetical protein